MFCIGMIDRIIESVVTFDRFRKARKKIAGRL